MPLQVEQEKVLRPPKTSKVTIPTDMKNQMFHMGFHNNILLKNTQLDQKLAREKKKVSIDLKEKGSQIDILIHK